MKHRIITTAIVTLLVIGTASPAIAKGPEANLKTKNTATIVAGDTSWVAINWQGKGGDITNFKVVAEAPSGVEVTYPENTPGFTGLMNGHVLSEKEMDFTALQVSVPYSQTKKFKIKLLVSYDADGTTVEDDFDVTVPVAVYQADQDVAQVTDSAGSIPSGESAWMEIDFTGLAPMVEGFDVVVSDPAGLTVSYPQAQIVDEPLLQQRPRGQRNRFRGHPCGYHRRCPGNVQPGLEGVVHDGRPDQDL